MSVVTWKIVEVDEILGNITVKFSNGVRENSNVFLWNGNTEEFASILGETAAGFNELWKTLPTITEETKQELLQMEGSSG